MRWNETVTLLAPANKYQDSTGAWHEGERTQKTVFCNEMIIGLMRLANLRSSDVRMANSTEPVAIGMRHEHMLQMRSIDFQSEDQCIYHGEEYEILYTNGAGEFITITIAQRIGSDVIENDG